MSIFDFFKNKDDKKKDFGTNKNNRPRSAKNANEQHESTSVCVCMLGDEECCGGGEKKKKKLLLS